MSLNSEHLISAALRSKTIAVVGLSKNPDKASNDVATYLKSHGYRIVPVNPTADEILGEKCYASLLDLPDELKREIEVVDIFRRPEDVPPIVEEAIEVRKTHPHLTTVWMQLGIVNEEAAEKARKAGLNVVMDRCMKIEHGRRLGRPF
jgi:predicted CoA-binding protein